MKNFKIFGLLNLIAVGIISGLFFSPAQSRADQVQYLGKNEAGLARLFAEARGAQKSIDLSYYIFAPCDSIGRLLIDELGKAVRRGVKVRVLLDAYTQKPEDQSKLTYAFAKRGIQLKFFNVASLLDPTRTYRSHIKLALFDGERYITGGRNIADDYFSMAETLNWVDHEVGVQGASAQTAQRNFERLWTHQVSSRVAIDRATNEVAIPWEKTCLNLREREVTIRQHIDTIAPKVATLAPAFNCAQTHFISDDPDFSSITFQGKPVSQALLKSISLTNKSIFSENYSYIPYPPMQRALEEKRNQNVTIVILTNSSSDVAGYLDSLKRSYGKQDSIGSMMVLGLPEKKALNDRFAMTPKNAFFMYHAKVFVFDRKDSYVSSFNIDPRSFHTNLESAMFAHNCPALATEIQAQGLKPIRGKDLNQFEFSNRPPADILQTILGGVVYDFI